MASFLSSQSVSLCNEVQGCPRSFGSFEETQYGNVHAESFAMPMYRRSAVETKLLSPLTPSSSKRRKLGVSAAEPGFNTRCTEYEEIANGSLNFYVYPRRILLSAIRSAVAIDQRETNNAFVCGPLDITSDYFPSMSNLQAHSLPAQTLYSNSQGLPGFDDNEGLGQGFPLTIDDTVSQIRAGS
jgi:hypothetical protein